MSLVYDAATVGRVLGFRCAGAATAPTPSEGEIVLYYGGWSLSKLQKSMAGLRLMSQDSPSYGGKRNRRSTAGYYRLLLPVPDSNYKNWDEQLDHLRRIDEAWRPAPVAVAVTALLVHMTESKRAFRPDLWCNCAEPYSKGRRIILHTSACGVLIVGDYWDHQRLSFQWLAAAQKVA